MTGLASGASVVLLDNDSGALTVSADGNFAFATQLAGGSSYAVTVGTQPAGQTCSVSGGSGAVGIANVTNPTVSCTNNTYTIGGTVIGLDVSRLVLANGTDTLSVPANATSFTVPKMATDGTAYDVTVQTHPAAVGCSIAGGAGTVSGSNVPGISVTCTPGTESVLHSFGGGTTDGSSPGYGARFQPSAGAFYGTTELGGATGRVPSSRSPPAAPRASVFLPRGNDRWLFSRAPDPGNRGDFYRMTQTDGASNDGVVFKITPGGTETVLYSFQGGTADGANPWGGLVQASDGNLYGVTHSGGASNAGVIFGIGDGPLLV